MADGAERVAVVTGATSGIGQWIARGVAKAGYRTVLVGRDAARLAGTRDWLAREAPDAAVETERAELSLQSELRRLAGALRARHPRIALLVNNAGLITWRRRETAEGHETILAVNHLAPFLLSGLLEPALRAAGRARIVNTGSNMSDRARIDPNDLELAHHRWSIPRAYSRSKLALLMTSFERARRLTGTGVSVNVVHPGLVRTRIGDVGPAATLFWRALTLLGQRPEQGADTPLHVALAPELGEVTGRYFKKRQEAPPNRLALDPALVARVWAATERLTAG